MNAKKFPTLSLCMTVKNEEKLLPECLESVKSIVDEIIVIVDAGSKDSTAQIAKLFGAKVFFHQWEDDFRAARNEYLGKASGEWILVMDADERIARKDLNKLRNLLLNKMVSGYICPVRNYTDDSNQLRREWCFSNGEYPKEEICSGWFPSENVNLFRNQKGLYYGRCLLNVDVGESILKLGGRMQKCSIPFHHHSYLKYNTFDTIKKKQLHYLELSLKSLKVYSKNANTYFNIGEILFLYKGDYRSSIVYLKKALKLRLDFLRCYWLLSLVYQKQKEFSKAEKVFKIALDIGPKQKARTFFLLGFFYLKQLDLLKANAYLKKAIRSNRYNPTTHNALGAAYEIQGKFTLAINEYRKAIAINKRHPDAYYNLGRIYSSLGQFQKAIRLYREALDINYHDSRTRNDLKILYSLTKKEGGERYHAKISKQQEKKRKAAKKV